jgi:hypothetical protein
MEKVKNIIVSTVTITDSFRYGELPSTDKNRPQYVQKQRQINPKEEQK